MCICVGLPSSNIRARHSRVSCLTASWHTSRATETGNAQKFLQRGNEDLCHSPRITQRADETELSAYLQSLSADSESDPLQWWEDHRDGPFAQARMWSHVTIPHSCQNPLTVVTLATDWLSQTKTNHKYKRDSTPPAMWLYVNERASQSQPGRLPLCFAHITYFALPLQNDHN